MTPKTLATSSLLTRPTLLFRLRDWDDAPSWEEFYRLYRRLVYGLAYRAGLSHTESEDVVQEVFRHVAEKIAEFEARPQRGAFRRWLMNQTRWRITDRFRDRFRHAGGGSAPVEEHASSASDIEQLPAPDADELEAAWESEWQRHILDAAMERLARRVPPRHFQAFDLYSRHGWSALRVARELGITTAGVYMYNHRLTKQLRVEVKRLEHSAG